ncbi:MAG: DUF4348 domain-containing protein [Bacteroidales bacterium]|nr:DUF4348 domain-containing protein [Bacteroidales bacterium]
MQNPEPEQPKTVDESFTDFIYNFSTDERIQRSRINFPLSSYSFERRDTIQQAEWTFDPMLSAKEVYTEIYSNNDSIEVEEDMNSTSAQVEWIDLWERSVKRYYFERINGKWKLEAIDHGALATRDSSANKEDFYEFYRQFTNDSTFQSQRVADPLKYITADPDNEFDILQTTLEPGQWWAFKPDCPTDVLTNIVHNNAPSINESNHLTLSLKGFGNGFINKLYFERDEGRWMLVQFEDVCD